MYTFNEDTLKHLLMRVKEQIDKKQNIEEYLAEAKENDENILIIGTDAIDQQLIDKSGFTEGTAVVIKKYVTTEVDFTAEEKEALDQVSKANDEDGIISKRFSNVFFKPTSLSGFQMDEILDEIETDKIYIISNEENKGFVAFIDEYMIKNQIQDFIDNKIEKQENRVLNEVDYTEERAEFIDAVIESGGAFVLKTDIVDNLESTDSNKILSANQGRILKEEYLNNKKFEYENIEEEINGLTAQQVAMLESSYVHSLKDHDESYADKKEVSNARVDNKGVRHASLSRRINSLEGRLKSIINTLDDVNSLYEHYGVRVNFEEDIIERIGNSLSLNQEDFNNIYPWSKMKKCNVLDGNVIAYQEDSFYAEDGSNGDVMVEIPKFYYRVVPLKTEMTENGLQLLEAKWMISSVPLKSFNIHPAFIRNGMEVNHIYVGAYEGSIYDVSASSYLYLNEPRANFEEDKLVSIVGTQPCTGSSADQLLTIDNARSLCLNKGEGYEQFDFTTLSALQMLYLVEYASFNSQVSLGLGIVNSDHNHITGSENSVNYRGIENLWGNVHTFVNGFIYDHNSKYAYWANNEANLITYNHKKFKFKIPQMNGYIDRLGYDENNDFAFLPIRATGSNITGCCDNCQTNDNTVSQSVLLSGGNYNSGELAGLYCLNLNWLSSACAANVGTRLQFYK